jgi:NAD(P)-dependent dehydrogenase (short-subunit alcohol dehydrogenase family)
MAAETLDGPRGNEIRGESPFGRVATPLDVASAVLYLASPEAEFASGTTVDVNGASYLHL